MNLPTISLRASSAPTAMLCGQSARPGMRVESGGRDPADMGTGVHEIMSSWITNGQDAGLSGPVAATLGLDRDELAKLSYIAWGLWREMAEHFPEPQTEVPMEHFDEANGIRLTGHCDLLSMVDAQVRVCDWKSGHGEGDHEAQLRAYAYLALQRYPEATSVYAAILRVRDGSVEGFEWSRQDVFLWFAGMIERLKDETYRVGKHCGFCSRGATCEAKSALLRQCVDSFSEPVSDAFLPVEPSARAAVLESLLARARLVEKASAIAVDLVRAEVRAAGGSIVCPSGAELRIDSEERRSVVFPEALPILSEELGTDCLAKILRASKGDVEEAVSNSAPRGTKGKRIKEVLARLDEAGAIRVSTTEKLVCRKAPKTLSFTERQAT